MSPILKHLGVMDTRMDQHPRSLVEAEDGHYGHLAPRVMPRHGESLARWDSAKTLVSLFHIRKGRILTS
jgi:hypothetical protein